MEICDPSEGTEETRELEQENEEQVKEDVVHEPVVLGENSESEDEPEVEVCVLTPPLPVAAFQPPVRVSNCVSP